VAVAALAARAAERWAAAVLPALRRIATERSVSWPGATGPPAVVAELAAPPPPVPLPAPEPRPGVLRALVAGAAGGSWRAVLVPVLAVPTFAVPALGGRSMLPLALGAAVAGLVAAGRAHRTAAERALLRRWSAEVVAATHAALEAELWRRLLELERVGSAELDEAVARRRAEVEAELRDIAAEGGG
jgi:hypothetical protein